MKRPSLFLLLFIVIGIFAGRYAENMGHIALFAMASGVLTLIVSLTYKNKSYILFILPTFLGLILAMNAGKAPLPKLDNYSGDIIISGRIKAVNYYPENSKNGSYIVKMYAYKADKDYDTCNANIRLYSPDRLNVGDIIAAKGKIHAQKGKSNPSDFDFKSYMLARKQYYTLSCKDISVKGNRHTIGGITEKIKLKVCDIYYNVMEPKEASLMCAMLVGETHNLDEELNNIYKRVGIYHVIAISGLHVSLLGAVLLWLLKPLGDFASKFITLFLLSCYCIMSGCSVSVVRAVLMFYIITFSKLIGTKYDLLSSGAVTASMLLIYSPYYLFDGGFQLSFVAVFAIGAFSQWLENNKAYKLFGEAIGINLAVDVATKPIIMWHFYYFNMWSLVANILLVPLMSLAVAAGFIIAFVGFISYDIAGLIAKPTEILLKTVESWCNIFNSMPLSQIVTGKPSIGIITAIAIAIFVILIYNSFKRGKNIRAVAMIYILLAGFVIKAKAEHYLIKPQVTFLDVGQGDCAVGILKNHTFVVDCGSANNKEVGQNILMPYLTYSGRDRINSIFISHTDNDHISGIIELLGRIKVDTIYLSKIYTDNDSYKLLKKYAGLNDVEIKYLKAGDMVFFDENVYISCLYPIENAKSQNDISMVNKFVYGNSSILFTGDLEKVGEQRLMSSGGDIRADIIKLPHHGGGGANNKAFYEVIMPKAAIASARKSIYGHPNDKTLSTLKDLDIDCYVTENNGAVKVSFDKEAIKVQPYLEVNDEH